MMRSRLNVLPLMPFLSLLFQPGLPAVASASGHVSLSGSQVHVYNLVGKAELVPGSGTSVLIDLVEGGRDGDKLSNRTFSEGGTFFVVTYPSNHIRSPRLHWGSSSTIQVAKDGTFGDHPKRGGWLDRKVRIDGSGGLEAWCDMRISVPKGQHLSVHVGVGEVNVTNVNGELVLDTASAPVTSSGGRGSLLVDTGSGEIAVTDRAGDLSLDTGSGSVHATNVTGDQLVFDTGSGDVIVRGARAQRISADTGSGGVTLSGVASPSVHVDTGSGDVRLALTQDIEVLDVDTGSGSVTIQAPPTLGASLRIETGSGDIDSDFPLRVTRRESDTLLATVGNGQGRIVIDTGSGDVRLVRAAAN
jgi:lia operon protein LiaG